MAEPTKVEVVNPPEQPVQTHQVPQQQVQPSGVWQVPSIVQLLPQMTDALNKAGPNGFVLVLFGSLISVILCGAMYMMYASLSSGQQAAKIAQDHLYEQLKAEQKSSEAREDKLIDRSDKLAKDQYDRWEKSREKQIETAAKLDVLLLEVKAINLAIKNPATPEKK